MDEVAITPSPPRGLSWRGILAGAFVTTAIGDVLVMLGVAVGLAAWDPTARGTEAVIGAVGGGAWTTVAIVAATLAGAFLSVRSTAGLSRTQSMMQGVATWAVALEATLLTLVVLSVGMSVAGSIADLNRLAPEPYVRPSEAMRALSGAAWWFCISGVLGAAAGAVGGLAAHDALPEVRPRKRVILPANDGVLPPPVRQGPY